MSVKEAIRNGNTTLGIEFGSTRIKAVLIDEHMKPLAQGAHEWENHLEDGIWTYSEEEILAGMQDCYADLCRNVKAAYGEELHTFGAIGISAMMHGYMAFDREGKLLVPFRTWRNTMTEEAAAELTELFSYNIPQRWSIAHLYQAMLRREEHLSRLSYLTTLAGYIHRKLTGEKVLGVGDASGMFPIDPQTKQYYASMAETFDARAEALGYGFRLADILPKVLLAGEPAGTLTREGALLLDPSGALLPGIPFCPPEGDAGTGMTATNSIAVRSGNVSAGTSVFAMVVLEKELSRVYPEIDLVTTPAGAPVGMVHCNNCTSDLNAWVGLFGEFAALGGHPMKREQLFELLYTHALTGDADCGGLLSYGCLSGEPVIGLGDGRPMLVRTPDSRFTLANLMRAHLYSALSALKIGMDLMLREESVKLDCLTGHGGFFKTKGVGQRIMASAAGVPVSVMETAGEGGAWGIALLAAYLQRKKRGETLEDFLAERVFADSVSETMEPDPEDAAGFERFVRRYRAGLPAEQAAAERIPLWRE